MKLFYRFDRMINGIEWKFVIEKMMYYKENVIFRIISIT